MLDRDMLANISLVFLNLTLHDNIILLSIHALIKERCAFPLAELRPLQLLFYIAALVEVFLVFGGAGAHLRVYHTLQIGLTFCKVIVSLPLA